MSYDYGVTRLRIKRNGIRYVLKNCKGCGDEWYAKEKQNRCSLCGSGLEKSRLHFERRAVNRRLKMCSFPHPVKKEEGK